MLRIFSHFACALILCSVVNAQDDSKVQGGPLSIHVGLSWNAAVSSSMRESSQDFRNELKQTYTNSGYPFAPSEVTSVYGADLLLQYGLQNRHSSLLCGLLWNYFDNEQSVLSRTALPAPNDYAKMKIYTLMLGYEYNLFDNHDAFAAYARGALLASLIGGSTHVTTIFPNDLQFTTLTNVPNTGCLGYALELGSRWRIPATHFGLEASVQYLNTNLLGKSYEAPSAVPDNDLFQRELNDGADPANAADHARTIDFLRFRLGAYVNL